jgi:predicted nucleotidyltransferase
MIEEVQNALDRLHELCRHHNVRRLELFGSATDSRFDPLTSDLDFIVEFGPFPAGGYSEHYFGLLDELGQLFERPVDLVVAHAVRNPYLLEGINRSRELLYAACGDEPTDAPSRKQSTLHSRR